MDNEETTALPRRKFLRNVGIGAAVAWSAPVLTTVGLSAAAGTHACTEGSRCQNAVFCGNDCACATTTEGNVVCAFVALFCQNVPSCTSSADCGADSVCIVDTCCQTPVCVPTCGAQRAGVQIEGGTPIFG